MGIKETLGDIWETPLWGAVELLVGWDGGNLLRKWIDNQKPIDQIIIIDVIQLIYDVLNKYEIQNPDNKELEKVLSLYVKLIKSAQIEINYRVAEDESVAY